MLVNNCYLQRRHLQRSVASAMQVHVYMMRTVESGRKCVAPPSVADGGRHHLQQSAGIVVMI
jgi:hypothetical protein